MTAQNEYPKKISEEQHQECNKQKRHKSEAACDVSTSSHNKTTHINTHQPELSGQNTDTRDVILTHSFLFDKYMLDCSTQVWRGKRSSRTVRNSFHFTNCCLSMVCQYCQLQMKLMMFLQFGQSITFTSFCNPSYVHASKTVINLYDYSVIEICTLIIMFINSLVMLVIQKSKFTAAVARSKNSYSMCLKGIFQSFSITKLRESQETDLKKKGQNQSGRG